MLLELIVMSPLPSRSVPSVGPRATLLILLKKSIVSRGFPSDMPPLLVSNAAR